MLNEPPRILVIGGGVSGLACAFRLRALNLPVLIVERSPRFGGVIDTIEKNGFRFDIGPQSFLATAALQKLIAELNLSDALVRANPRSPRYILLHGQLIAAPLNPVALLTTPLFGWRTKLRMLAEPFGKSQPPQADESIAAFMRRKFGEDLLNNLVAPFISGVYAGNPEWLSLQATFPMLPKAEQEHGSVIRGMMKSRKPRKKGELRQSRPSLCNFREGLLTLTNAIAAKLGDCAKANTDVAMIRASAPSEPRGFNVALSENGAIEPIHVGAIIVATQTQTTARLLESIDPRFPETLQGIEYAPVAQVSAGYRYGDISKPELREKGGFGFLVPRKEGLRSLGTVFNSFLFPNRAPESPEKMANFTTFLGGATDREICSLTLEEIATIAHSDVAKVLGIRGGPVVQHVSRWDRALPQYNLGHSGIVRSLGHLCAQNPGVFLAGNYLGGPSIGACVEQANKITEEVVGFAENQKATADPSL
jgi:oxygen-dependent protoporphyrinogen oxidase